MRWEGRYCFGSPSSFFFVGNRCLNQPKNGQVSRYSMFCPISRIWIDRRFRICGRNRCLIKENVFHLIGGVLPLNGLLSDNLSGVRRKKIRWVQGRVSRFVGGLGAENFRKFAKKLPEENWKMLYFRLFWKEITKLRVKFSRVWTINASSWRYFKKKLWKLSKSCKKSPKKIAKTAVISPILQRNYKPMR